MTWARRVALFTAAFAWAALALQFALIVARMTGEGTSFGAAAWRFLGFFTILTNGGVALVATAMVLGPQSMLAGPRARLATASAIVIVGIVYSVALRATWQPTGWQAVADHALHDVTPPLFALSWLLAGHGALAWRDIGWALAAPSLYVAYALARGAVDGWYAYWFLDPGALSAAAIAGNLAVLLAVFSLVAALLVAVDRWLARAGSGAGQ